MASIENKDIIEVSNVDPTICRNIYVNSIYSFQSILIANRWVLFWLPPFQNLFIKIKLHIINNSTKIYYKLITLHNLINKTNLINF